MDKISSISNLEAGILNIVWDRGTVTNREIYEFFIKEEIKGKDSNFIPYTTIMSTMNKLAEKRILKIDRTKKTHIYSVIINKKQLAKSIIRSVAEKLL